jgi:ribonuclease G
LAKNTLVINCDVGETRVALIENGILAELHVERRASKGIVGNIYLGKVSRVLPGMQAAFIDIGEERAAFLHVEDLIRPADFEAYLAGSKQEARTARREVVADDADTSGDDDDDDDDDDTDEVVAAGETSDTTEEQAETSSAIAKALEAGSGMDPRTTLDTVIEPTAVIEPDAPVLRELREEDEVVTKIAPRDSEMATRRRRRRGGRGGAKRQDIEADASASGEGAVADAEGEIAAEGDDDGTAVDEQGELLVGKDLGSDPPPARKAKRTAKASVKPEAGAEAKAPKGLDLGEGLDDLAAEFGYTVSDAPLDGAAATEAAPRDGLRDRRDRLRDARRRRSERPGAKTKEPVARKEGREGREGREARNGKQRDGGLRLARSTPINEVVKEGQQVIVQVTKDPIGTKGARVSSHVSLPGRYVVYMPTVEHVGVSRRIGNDVERRRLREAIEAMKPPQGGLIVRTVAEGLTKKHLKADVGYLVRLWGEIAKKKEGGARAPTLLYQELDVVLRTARDMFTDDVEKIVIDDKEQYQRLLRFIEMFMPERAKDIELYGGDEPIFDAYGLEDEIARALSRKVPLPSGGYLIIDQAEALTAIDVNSGRFVGKGNKDPEDTILQTNLEAVQEIAYQLRFRNIGGLIVLDLIDMDKAGNREKVYRALEQALHHDKAKTSINRISELGLVEMTRKRTRESLGRLLHESCFYCDGTGQLQSRTTIAYEILRQIRRERKTLAGYKVVVNAHPSVVDLLQTEERETLRESERRYQRQIMLVPHKEYHIEQFDLQGG